MTNFLLYFISTNSCFLIILVIAIIVFQIKRRYDDYHRRQQVRIELKRMAKRPFAMINFFVLPTTSDQQRLSTNGPVSERQLKMGPTVFQGRSPPMPVTLQPLSQPGAAVMTVLIQLPLVSPVNNDGQAAGAPSALAAGSVIVRAGKFD